MTSLEKELIKCKNCCIFMCDKDILGLLDSSKGILSTCFTDIIYRCPKCFCIHKISNERELHFGHIKGKHYDNRGYGEY